MRRTILPSVVMILVLSSMVLAFADSRPEVARALEVMSKARAAIGSEETLKKLHGLTIKGKFRRVIQQMETSGDRQFDISFPDKFLRSETFSPMGADTVIKVTRVMNNEDYWMDNGRGGSAMFIINGGKLSKEDEVKLMKQQARAARAELARYMISMFLTPQPGFHVEYVYAGEAEAEPGQPGRR